MTKMYNLPNDSWVSIDEIKFIKPSGHSDDGDACLTIHFRDGSIEVCPTETYRVASAVADRIAREINDMCLRNQLASRCPEDRLTPP